MLDAGPVHGPARRGRVHQVIENSRQVIEGRSTLGAASGRRGRVSRIVVLLGLTSFLADISSEMVSTVLPLYLVMVLGLPPLQFGIIDGIQQGASVLVRLGSGFIADRRRDAKAVAVLGYALSALTRPALLLAQGAAAFTGIIVVDRVGKGIRTAPRDAGNRHQQQRHGLKRCEHRGGGADEHGRDLPIVREEHGKARKRRNHNRGGNDITPPRPAALERNRIPKQRRNRDVMGASERPKREGERGEQPVANASASSAGCNAGAIGSGRIVSKRRRSRTATPRQGPARSRRRSPTAAGPGKGRSRTRGRRSRPAPSRSRSRRACGRDDSSPRWRRRPRPPGAPSGRPGSETA